MDDYIKGEITSKIIIHGSPNVRIPYASKTLIPKEELVLDKERNILSPKLEIIFLIIKEKFEYKVKAPHEGQVCNSNCANSLLSLLHPFADLIIGEAAGTPPSDPLFFAGYHRAANAPEVRRTRYR